MVASHFSVLTPVEFIADVVLESKHAKKRIWAQAMEVEPGKYTDELLLVLKDGSKRGLDTKLHADYYSLLVTDGVFNYWPFVTASFRKRKRHILAKKHAMVRDLKDEHVSFLFTNPPTMVEHLLPTKGRNHMKIVIIDSISYIGGVNFHEDNFLAEDIMLKITDPEITAEIAYIYDQMHKREPIRDMAITISDTTTLLIDGGAINHSIILRYSIEAIERAQTSLKLISPLIPDASLLKALARAQKRGVIIDIICPHVNHMIGVYGLVDSFNLLMTKIYSIDLPITYKRFPIHAKILIRDDQEVIVGSHNFSNRGVRMGTEEIALQSTHPTMVSNMLNFFASVENKS